MMARIHFIGMILFGTFILVSTALASPPNSLLMPTLFWSNVSSAVTQNIKCQDGTNNCWQVEFDYVRRLGPILDFPGKFTPTINEDACFALPYLHVKIVRALTYRKLIEGTTSISVGENFQQSVCQVEGGKNLLPSDMTFPMAPLATVTITVPWKDADARRGTADAAHAGFSVAEVHEALKVDYEEKKKNFFQIEDYLTVLLAAQLQTVKNDLRDEILRELQKKKTK